MRLLKLGVYHPTYLRDFYEARPKLGAQNYSTQHRALMDDCFGSADFWTQAFVKLNYQTADLVANAEPLQKCWARENDLRFDDRNWIFEIAAAQIKDFRPDVLLVADYSTFTAQFLRTIRRECSSIRLILGWCGAPYGDSAVFGEWDIALSCIPEMVAEFKRCGQQSFHINHAFAPRVLEKLDLTSPPAVDFLFTGSIVKRDEFHIERENLLRALVERTNLQIRSNLKRQSFKQRQKFYAARQADKVILTAHKNGVPEVWLDALPLTKRIREAAAASAKNVAESVASRAQPAVFGVEMFQTLRNSRVVLNNHIDISRASASNMRLFEATGVGTCLLTDWKENLRELFEPETEVLTYRSAEECVEKVKYILEHENERRAIAAAGQQKTLREHTFDDRVAQIDEIINNSVFR